jgi:hypothetical protein
MSSEKARKVFCCRAATVDASSSRQQAISRGDIEISDFRFQISKFKDCA